MGHFPYLFILAKKTAPKQANLQLPGEAGRPPGHLGPEAHEQQEQDPKKGPAQKRPPRGRGGRRTAGSRTVAHRLEVVKNSHCSGHVRFCHNNTSGR